MKHRIIPKALDLTTFSHVYEPGVDGLTGTFFFFSGQYWMDKGDFLFLKGPSGDPSKRAVYCITKIDRHVGHGSDHDGWTAWANYQSNMPGEYDLINKPGALIME